ncbi:hypothetical protein GK091_24835 [Spirosoma agri]|uniref:Uncharacterized protein n=1 Tax=Spirosoma agri TaxID=1987381 RepID=A0A6M0IPC4_9BACT|nr:hypothetical protein [Spirosoma agri]NEU70126.1 hypothetical protein [Spirosoma agri]
MDRSISQQALDELYDYVSMGFGAARVQYSPFLATQEESDKFYNRLWETARALAVFYSQKGDKHLLTTLNSKRGSIPFRHFVVTNAPLFKYLIDVYEADQDRFQ